MWWCWSLDPFYPCSLCCLWAICKWKPSPQQSRDALVAVWGPGILRMASSSLGERWCPKTVPQPEHIALRPGGRWGCGRVQERLWAADQEVWCFGLACASSSSDCASCSCLSRQGPGATSLLSDDSVTSCSCRLSYSYSYISRYIHSVYVCLSPLAVYLKLSQHC